MDPLSLGLIMGGSSLASGLFGFLGSSKASDEQAKAAAAALAFQKQVYAQNSANAAPFINTGQGATYKLSDLYGLGAGPGGSGTGTGMPDFSAFTNSPDYQFAKDQGLNATQNVLSARGGLLSGGGLAALTNFGSGLASQQFQNYVSRLTSLASLGSNSAGALAGSNVQSGNQVGNTNMALGTAQASGTMGGFNAIGGGLSGAASGFSLPFLLNMAKGGGNNNVSSYFQTQTAPGMGFGYPTV